ncbi:cdc42 effector protein 2 isoform X2 [Lepisosteus oculatus]
MSAKAPIYLKRGSRKGKKEKLRDLLSSDMISPPLGDFRHTIHIGSGGGEGDLFGDLSFLQGKFHLLPGRQRPGEGAFEFARTASVCGGHPVSPSSSSSSSESSPLLKNAISLPVIGGVQALTLPAAQPPPKPPRLHLDERPAPPPSPPVPEPLSSSEEPPLSHAGSLLSLHLDLGPSILEDVLQIMDKHRLGGVTGGCLPSGRQEIFT